MEGNQIDPGLTERLQRGAETLDRRDEVNGDMRELYAEVKEAGFDVTMFRMMLKEYRMDPDARNSLYQSEQEYRAKAGLLAGLPLGDAALEREQREAAGGNAPDYPTHRWGKPPEFAKQPVHRGRRKAAADDLPAPQGSAD